MPAPANDTCATAIDITALLPYTATVDTSAATQDTGLPAGSGYGGSFDTTVAFGVWYKITPTFDMRIQIKTDGSNYETYVQVYSGSCAGLTPVDANIDWAIGVDTSRLPVALTAGTTYFILFGSLAGVGGSLSVSIAQTSFPMFRSINPVVSAGGPLSINVPGSPKKPSAGDLVFCLLGHKEADWSTPPAGFTLVDRAISGSLRGELYVKTSDGAEGSTYSFTLPSSGAIAAVGLAFAVGAGTLNAHSVRANGSAASGSASITPTKPYSWIFSLGVRSAYSFGQTFSAWGALGFEEIEDTGTLNETGVAIGFSAITLTPAGATGDSSWTSSVSGDSVGFLIAVGANAAVIAIPVDDSKPCCGTEATPGGPGTGVALPPAGTAPLPDWTPVCAGGGVYPAGTSDTNSESWAVA
jgi:hypothetical protein